MMTNRRAPRLISLVLITLCLQACSNGENSDQQNASAPAPGMAPEAAPREIHPLLAALPADADPEDTTFQTLDGRGFDIELFEGRKVFVNFWATWCAPCIREIPSINRAAAALEEEDYIFLFVSDEETAPIEEFLAERQFPGNFVKLNGFFGNFGIGAVPSSWLLDETGEVAKTWAGAYEWGSEEMIADIRSPAPE